MLLVGYGLEGQIRGMWKQGGEHTIDAVAKPATTASPNPAHSESTTDVGSSPPLDSDSE